MTNYKEIITYLITESSLPRYIINHVNWYYTHDIGKAFNLDLDMLLSSDLDSPLHQYACRMRFPEQIAQRPDDALQSYFYIKDEGIEYILDNYDMLQVQLEEMKKRRPVGQPIDIECIRF